MPTSYTSLLGLALPITGELAGQWGDVVNNYITSYIDASVAGTQTISGSQTAVSLAVSNGSSLVTVGSGATGSAQFQIINCTGNPAGLLTITAPASSRQYIIINATSTNQSVKIVGTGPTTGVTLIAGEKAHVAWNGSDFVKIATQNGSGDFVTVDTTNLEVTNIKAKDGTASMTLADTTGIITLSATAGTANGVLYLNGSRAVTSGSALTFDGTWLTSTYPSAGLSELGLQARYSGAFSTVGLGQGSNGVGYLINNHNAALSFGTNASEKIRLLGGTGANLNIGGNFTSTNNTLQVTGNAAIGYTTAAPTTGLIVAGNVGIGTDSPATKLHLYGGAGSAPKLTLDEGGAQGVVYATRNSATNGDLRFQTMISGTLADRMLIDYSGNVLLRQNSNAANTSVSFNTTVQNALTLDSDGDLGIGTNSPSRKLDIALTPAAQVTGATIRSVGGTTNIGDETSIDFQVFSSTYYNGRISGYVESITGNGKGGLKFYTSSAGTSINATPSVTLDSSGNLGLGVTPSAWSGQTAFQLVGSAAIASSNQYLDIQTNSYYNAGSKYIGTGLAARYTQAAGVHQWFTAPSGTAGNAISFTQAMTLDASGRLGIGATSPSTRLTIGATSDAEDVNIIRVYRGGSVNQYAEFSGKIGHAYINSYNGVGGTVTFAGDGTERARIDTAGTLILRQSSNAANTSVSFNTTVQNALTLDSSGNLGLGATPSAYNNRGFDISSFVGLSQNSAGAAALAFNNFQNSAGNYIYKTTNAAARYDCGNEGGGRHAWFIAGSGTQNTTVPFTQAMTLDASGNLLVGTTTTTNNLRLGAKLAVVSAGTGAFSGANITAYSGTTATSASFIDLNRSRGNTDGSMTVVANGDALGYLVFRGSDGASFLNAAEIYAQVDGTPGTNDMPGRLIFTTTADGASSPTERMRLDSSGNLGLGATSTTGYWPANLTQTAARQIVSYSDATTNLDNANAGLVIFNSNSTAGSSSKLVFGANNSDPVPVGLAYISAVNSTRSSGYLSGSLVFGTAVGGGGAGTGPTERARITSGGNVEVNSASSGAGWSGTATRRISVLGGGYAASNSAALTLSGGQGDNNTASGWEIRSTASGATGSLVNTLTFNVTSYTGSADAISEKARITSGGNLLVGTTTDGGRLTVQDAVSAGRVNVTFLNNAAGNTSNRMRLRMAASSGFSGTDLYPYMEAFEENAGNAAEGLAFGTYNGSALGERARITSAGQLLVGTNSAIGSERFLVRLAAADYVGRLENDSTTAANCFGLFLRYGSAAPNGTGNLFLRCDDSAATRAEIRSNGGLANYQSNNVDLSDIRTKTDISPLASYWNKIAALEIVTYKYKDQTHDDLNIGVIAQQVEQVAPEFVDADGFGETPEDGVPLKTIYNKDLTFAAIKALQEAMARIEQLEAKVAALEAK